MRLRFFWERLDKTPIFIVAFLSVVMSAFAFVLYTIPTETQERQHLKCLALNVYFEARGEPEAGQYAVAEVTMNRVASRHYPNTVCGVVYQKNWDPLRKRYVSAFSWTEFASLPAPSGPQWEQALKISEDVYYRRRPPQLAGVLHYHADHVAPSWSREMTLVATIGNHLFYK